MADTFTPEGIAINNYSVLSERACIESERMSAGLTTAVWALGVTYLQDLLRLAEEMERTGTPVDDVTLHFTEPARTAIRRARTEGWA